jgi:hypothetical protein
MCGQPVRARTVEATQQGFRIVLFWGLSFLYAPRLGVGEPTPWLGVIERIALGVWLLWLAVLAIVVMRGPRALSSRRRREGSATSAALASRTLDAGEPSVRPGWRRVVRIAVVTSRWGPSPLPMVT